MTARRVLILMTAGLAAIAGAMYVSSLRLLDRDPRGEAFLQGLQGQLDSITDLRLRKGGAVPAVSLHRIQPGRWVIVERDNYPADLTKIRALLLALSEIKVVEEKTSNPANYAVLGVEDPKSASAGGVEVSLVSPARSISVIVGRAAGDGSFVRRAEEAKSFAVEPAVTVDTAIRDWIDAKLFDIPVEKIQSIRMDLTDGTRYSIERPAPAAGKNAAAEPFKLAAVPAGREANDPAMIAPAATTFSAFTADDLAPASSVDFSKGARTVIQLFDGETYTLAGVVNADKHWITLSASKDAALNERVRGRAFEVPGYRYDALFRPLEQLLKPRPTASPAARASKSKPARP